MTRYAMFAPMGGLAAVTFAVLLLIPLRRFAALRRGAVTVADFRLGESPAVPEATALANRNFMNILELPTLFYAICLMFVVADSASPATLGIAWIYVAARAAHTAIHVTYNNVLHRLVVFAISNVVLVTLWAMFFLTPHGR